MITSDAHDKGIIINHR